MYALRLDSTDPAFNLALEETLFESLSPENPSMFLIWRNAPAVIIGCHQNTAEEVNEVFCREHGIAVVRRPTGGGAVYHDLGNVNFSFLVWVEKSRLAGFDEFMRPMVAALRDLGVDAAYTSRNDITVDGRKVAGTAQRRSGQRMLHHGCLLVDVDTSVLSGALAADPEKFHSKGVASHRARIANLREFLADGNGTGDSLPVSRKNDATAFPGAGWNVCSTYAEASFPVAACSGTSSHCVTSGSWNRHSRVFARTAPPSAPR